MNHTTDLLFAWAIENDRQDILTAQGRHDTLEDMREDSRNGSITNWPTDADLAGVVTVLANRRRASDIKAECSAAIVNRVDEKDQRNLTALAVRHLKRGRGGPLNIDADAQLDMIDDIFDWIQTMKEESRHAIRDGNDPDWPAWNDEWNPLIGLV